MNTDFYDDDLLRSGKTQPESTDESDGVPVRSISDDSLSRVAVQKEQLSNQMAGAVQEIERLRMKQEGLEREKSTMEDLSRKQEEYERGKREIMEKLGRSIVLVEKEQVQAVRMSELLSETRALFNDTLSELEKIDEETWSDSNFEAELNRGLALIENARMDYRKALAKIDASSWHKSSVKKDISSGLDETKAEIGTEKSFNYWLKVGFAVTLPLAVVMVILFLIHMFITSGIWI